MIDKENFLISILEFILRAIGKKAGLRRTCVTTYLAEDHSASRITL